MKKKSVPKKAAPKKAVKKKGPPHPKVGPTSMDFKNKGELSDKRPWMLENKYAVGNHGGRPPLYETPEELQEEVDRYFEWINGISTVVEKVEEKEILNKRTKQFELKKITVRDFIWLRRPEPPTITGLTLYLGYASRGAMHDQKERSPEFSNIIARAIDRVTLSYEIDLRDRDKSKGSQFALPNIGSRDGWRNTQSVQNLDKDGKPSDPPKGVVITTLAPNLGKNL